MACLFYVQALIDGKGVYKQAVTAVSGPYLGQKPPEQNLGADHIMYCILYFGYHPNPLTKGQNRCILRSYYRKR